MQYKKINLGCGKDYLDGWINVDINKKFKVDLIADLSKPFPFLDNSIDEIKASDILEHFTKEIGQQFLSECQRVLKLNGIITLRTHNIEQIINQFKKDPQVMIHFIYGDTEKSGIAGAHKFAYTESTLRKLFRKIGFDAVSFTKETTNFIIVAKKIEKFPLSKLSIAVIQQSPDIGGAEVYMLSLIKNFLGKGHKIVVAGNKSKFIMQANGLGVKIIEIPVILDIIGNYKGLIKSLMRFPYALYIYINLLCKFKKLKIDVILMSGFSEKLLVSALSVYFRIPVVWIEYGSLKTIFPRNFYIPKVLYRLTKSIPRYVIVPSENTRQNLITEGAVSLAKLKLIPCGIIINSKNSDSKRKVVPEWQKNLIIGSVSRLTREKGQQFLIAAIPQVIKAIPNARFLIIGEGPDKEYFRQMVLKLNLSQYVRITGFVANLSDYYSAMDIFVFPTVWELEGFGLVLAESMTYKLPIVANNISPVTEIIEDDRSAKIVDVKDKHALATAIISFAKDKKSRKLFGERAYQRVIKNYTIEKAGNDILEVLQEAI
jgi:glycosyltransferase involved in cell wall biosynthesis/predicted SAM-dependent methyltransferase